MKKTTIIAGSIEITGELRNYEFTNENAVFNFVINPLDTNAVGELTLPKPQPVMVEAIQRLGIANLAGAVVNFNKSVVDIKKDSPAKKNSYVPGSDRSGMQIGGKFF